jgi:hypothetical protein
VANHWGIVKEHVEAKITDCYKRLAAIDSTPDIIQVRVYQAEIRLLQQLADLPDSELRNLRKSKSRA